MSTVRFVVAATLVVASACSDASPPGDDHAWPDPPPMKRMETETLGCGWSHPVTVANFGSAAAQKLGNAPDALAGHDLASIVSDPDVRVRGDARACVACHAWAAGIDRQAFCDRVPAFVAQPTSVGDGHDPTNAKPKVLKTLFTKWRERGCPD